MELAERLPRLWAAMIDRVLIMPLILATGFLIPFAVRQGGSSVLGIAGTAAAAVGALALAGYQIWLLTNHGQTIGKRVMGLRIVLVKDLGNGGFTANVLLRGVVPWVITMIPFAGMLFALADPLFIFREDRRCIHDHIAGTCVIKA